MLERFTKKGDIVSMNDFVKGMSTIGQLSPSPNPYPSHLSQASAWKGVANSFRQAGDNIRAALKEDLNEPKSKQTT